MERFNFSIVIEADEDKWFACIHEFEHLGVATWGDTREEAAKNLLEVAIMTFQDSGKDGAGTAESARKPICHAPGYHARRIQSPTVSLAALTRRGKPGEGEMRKDQSRAVS